MTDLRDTLLFLREFRHRTTGSIAPSSPALGRALTRWLVARRALGASNLRVLEVGAGTGAVTRVILEALGPTDTLECIEVNPRFCARLRDRFEHEATFAHRGARVVLRQTSVVDLPHAQRFDVVIACLPFNNFQPEVVRQILGVLKNRLAPGGVLSFFEYVGIRRLVSCCAGRRERERLREVAEVIDALLVDEFSRELVLVNAPPAWVHHVL